MKLLPQEQEERARAVSRPGAEVHAEKAEEDEEQRAATAAAAPVRLRRARPGRLRTAGGTGPDPEAAEPIRIRHTGRAICVKIII